MSASAYKRWILGTLFVLSMSCRRLGGITNAGSRRFFVSATLAAWTSRNDHPSCWRIARSSAPGFTCRSPLRLATNDSRISNYLQTVDPRPNGLDPESHLRAERSVCWLQFTADEAIEIQHHHKKAKIPGCVAQPVRGRHNDPQVELPDEDDLYDS